ncbi:MAG: hypothetical protein V4573_19930 [Pseudomonadota bacterium]
MLTRYLTSAHHAALSKRVTANGVRLEDVIRSGLRHPDSAIGVYAPDVESYEVFRELFEPILENFHAPSLSHRTDMACIHPAAVHTTRIRVARNLAGHTFPAGMSRSERLDVEQKITRACRSLALGFEGTVIQLKDLPPDTLDDMIANRLAFGPDDKYMAAAGIHDDWPLGRSVFNTHAGQLSVWINEEDHLRVAIVMPGAAMDACHEAMAFVMSRLDASLDFSRDAELGHLTSCPSNVGTGLRASYRVLQSLNAAQNPALERLAAAGVIQLRAPAGEHAAPSRDLVDVGLRRRVGLSERDALDGMKALLARH